MEILGIGTDILWIDSISSCVSDIKDPFVTRTFTEKEIALILSRNIPKYSFATRFSGKEAVFKALCVGGNDVRLKEIEILELENGQPYVILHGKAQSIAKEKGIKQVYISLSYDTDYAIAYAISVIG